MTDAKDVIELLTWQRDRAYAILAELCNCGMTEYGGSEHERYCQVAFAERTVVQDHPEFKA